MLAPRHAVFVSPGAVSPALARLVGLEPNAPFGAPTAPRLLGTFGSASEAERAAGAAQGEGLGTLVAGPEQPPAESAWRTLRDLELRAGSWHVTDTTGFETVADLGGLRAISVVHRAASPRPPADCAVLLLLETESLPVFVRRSALGPESAPRLAAFLDDCAGRVSDDIPARTRGEEEVLPVSCGLDGDHLPLALAVVHHLDTRPGSLSRPVWAPPRADPSLAQHGPGSAVARTVGFAWWASALLATPMSLWLVGSGLGGHGWSGAVAVAWGLFLAAWASQRLFWSRWLERHAWPSRGSPLPAWPLHAAEPGHPPHAVGLLLDTALIGLAWAAEYAGAPSSAPLATAWLWASPFQLVAGLWGLRARYVAERLDASGGLRRR